jgi:hypothetical protein
MAKKQGTSLMNVPLLGWVSRAGYAVLEQLDFVFTRDLQKIWQQK